MSKTNAPYLLKRQGIFYLYKRVPTHLISHYGKQFIRKSLRTRDRKEAVRAASSLVAVMEKEWNEQILNVPDSGSVFSLFEKQTSSIPLLSEAGRFYVEMKDKAGDKRFERYTSRVVAEVIGLAGDKLVSAYTRHDALAFRDALLERGSANATVKRNFECIRAIWNFAAREHGVGTANPFSNMNYGNGRGPVKRKSVPIEDIRLIQRTCFDMDDEIRWLVALLSDTGMRLSEAAGLIKSDIHLNSKVPHIRLKPHSWRPLKTSGSERDVPLVGAALWAINRASENADGSFLFPRYCTSVECKADHASNTLNKWLRKYLPEGCVVHSFRHSIRDRLRAVQCPSDVIDQIGGWQTYGIGNEYGEGHTLQNLSFWLKKLPF
ncbi:tyrosine-type recombinase/integrase [Alphaproteobacteria bacterium]|nr:tyrosine-type recombinase/integrase [Alphaproteobacteria bacterium]